MKKILQIIREIYNSKRKPLRILDFGCGDGRLIYEICNLEKRKEIEINKIIGVDISERAILFARAFLYDFRNKVRTYSKDIREINLSGKFDIITATEVLEHIPHKEMDGILKKIHELLAKEGTLIVSVPSVNLKKPKKHYRHYTIKSLKNELSKYFESVSCFYHICGPTHGIYRRILSNRLFILNWMPLLNLLSKTLGRKIERKRAKGINIICILRNK